MPNANANKIIYSLRIYLALKELGIEESGLSQLIKSTYSLLGLATYFTVGSDEVKAWTFKKGMKAPECAGIIHTDFEFLSFHRTHYHIANMIHQTIIG